MTDEIARVVRASREISAPAERIFELIADPAQQPSWDGNDNLAESAPGQRVRAVGEVFSTTLTNGNVRSNHVVEFVEGRLIAWRPSEPGAEPPGHLWRWELVPLAGGRTEATHTYDWSGLNPNDTMRVARARATTEDGLRASLENLAKASEGR
ncbi:SRPBCC family protein [Amycolatopsis benzoatilytica]|uniref:SRPBCC family protein n=1 Tax=Amycolatopsis benzoatilytica TaxID=346045 RepID=UPI000371D88F|nr:SRPBCC family protein [Amycolatopsis benzoatilytica]